MRTIITILCAWVLALTVTALLPVRERTEPAVEPTCSFQFPTNQELYCHELATKDGFRCYFEPTLREDK